MNKGQTTLVSLIVAGVFTLLASIGGAWISGSSAANDKLNDTKLETQMDFSADRQRIATVEEAIKTIKESQMETRNDVKEILKILGKK